MTGPRESTCDFCGEPIYGPVHHPHDPDCPGGDCQCDNQVCEIDCPTCQEEAATHPGDGPWETGS